jgi:hypothetical protein
VRGECTVASTTARRGGGCKLEGKGKKREKRLPAARSFLTPACPDKAAVGIAYSQWERNAKDDPPPPQKKKVYHRGHGLTERWIDYDYYLMRRCHSRERRKEKVKSRSLKQAAAAV